LTGFGANYYDYPKIGAPDAYYMADNVFDVTGTTYFGRNHSLLTVTKCCVARRRQLLAPASSAWGST
jgi:hypothetical protein